MASKTASTTADDEDWDGPPKTPRIKTPLELQLYTCSSVLITPMVSGLVMMRERFKHEIYAESVPKLVVDFLPLMGDIFGACICGFLLYWYGRKKNLIYTTLLFLVPQLVFVSDLHPMIDFSGIVALYFANRFLIVTLSVYVSEVVEPRFRAPFFGVYFIGLTLGHMAGNFLPSTSKLPIVGCFSLTITALVLAFLSPESPYFMTLKRRREEAEDLFDMLRVGASDLDESNALFNKADSDRQVRRQGIISQVYNRNFIVPVSIVFFMLLANNDMCYIIQPVLDELMAEVGTTSMEEEEPVPGSKDFNTVFLMHNILPVLGSMAFLGLTLHFGRRLMFVTSIGLSLLIFPLLHLSKRMGDIPKLIYTLCFLFTYLGSKQMTRIVSSEIFPSSVRELGVASCDSLETLIFLLQRLSLYGGTATWYYYIISNARWIFVPLGLTYTLFFLPETKDLPIIEAEILGRDLNVGPYFAQRPEDEED